MGDVYLKMKRIDLAIQCYTKAIEVREKSLPKNIHQSNQLVTLEKLARLHESQGQYEIAASFYETTLSVQKEDLA